MWNFVGLQARGYLILNDHLLLFDNWKNYNHVLKKKSNDTSLLSKVFNLQKRKMVFNYLFIFNGWPRPRHWERPKNVLCLGHLVLSLGKIHPVTGVCFLTLTAGGTHQLWDPHSCEWEEVYTRNRVYFLLSLTKCSVCLWNDN